MPACHLLSIGPAVQLCKIDAEGEARKVVGCSSVVVTNWGEETSGRSVLQEYLKNVRVCLHTPNVSFVCWGSL